MRQPETQPKTASVMAETLIGSEIIRIAGEVNEKIKQGEKVFNMTIGDFDPNVFPIPNALLEEIIAAYRAGHTNYPAANGILELRKAVSTFLKAGQGIAYSADEILISGGARPLIYATYLTLLDPGDAVIFPVPSWNNNHYCHLTGAKPILIEARGENNFMPVAEDIEPYLAEATLLTLCSPLNPTGTVFRKEDLLKICDLVLAENARREGQRKPLYVMYDQIYWTLTFGETEHFDPVTLRPAMRAYTIFIDGISKAFAATGVRVGWAFGPQHIMDKMKAILSHIGAWAPKAEQVATANYLSRTEEVQTYLAAIRNDIEMRLQAYHTGFQKLKSMGYPVESVAPQAAIYLTVKVDLSGKKTEDGKPLTAIDGTAFLLDQAGIALVPFFAFGAPPESPWFRLSVGTCKMEDIPLALSRLEQALAKLQ